MKNKHIYCLALVISIFLIALSVCFIESNENLTSIIINISCSSLSAAIIVFFIDRREEKIEAKKKLFIRIQYLLVYIVVSTFLSVGFYGCLITLTMKSSDGCNFWEMIILAEGLVICFIHLQYLNNFVLENE